MQAIKKLNKIKVYLIRTNILPKKLIVYWTTKKSSSSLVQGPGVQKNISVIEFKCKLIKVN